MGTHSIASPNDQSVSFVELFFDLVFVFSVSQVVGVLHDGLSWTVVAQALLVFWLVWWAWSQFTWALNASDTTNNWVQAGTLLATAVVFLMAIAVPGTFHGEAFSFAVPYVLVRILGLGLYLWATSHDSSHWRGVRTFAALSTGGLVAVIAGALLGGVALYWAWAIAIVLDVVAAVVAVRARGWELHTGHFAERHALFVIIALGESLIVAANAVVGDVSWSPDLIAAATLSVAMICCLWWTYFPRAKPRLEQELARRSGAQVASLARDVYTLAHYPMVCGIIAFAVTLESTLSHPTQPLPHAIVWLLASAVVLFVGTMGIALWVATSTFPATRLLLSLVTAGTLVLTAGQSAMVSLGIAVAGVAAVAVLEERNHAKTDPPPAGRDR